MRRSKCEIGSRAAIDQIINSCTVCRVGLAKDNVPYIVPLSFGYDGSAIYFHTAGEGMKVDFINAGNKVCFEFELGVNLLAEGETPCDWGFSYQSVVGHGAVEELTGNDDKVMGLNLILQQYVKGVWPMAPVHVANTRVWRINIESITGKQSEDHFVG